MFHLMLAPLLNAIFSNHCAAVLLGAVLEGDVVVSLDAVELDDCVDDDAVVDDDCVVCDAEDDEDDDSVVDSDFLFFRCVINCWCRSFIFFRRPNSPRFLCPSPNGKASASADASASGRASV